MATLGMPGDMLGEGEEAAVSTWRVGGHPVLPPGVQLDRTATQCRVCHSPLALVLQVSSTGAADGQPTATLVFGCTQRGCGKDSGSWRAVSLRLQQQPAVQQQQPADYKAVPAAGGGLTGLQPHGDQPDQATGSSADAASDWASGADAWQDAGGEAPGEGEPAWGSTAVTAYDSLAEQLSRAALSATEQGHTSAGGREAHAAEQQPAEQQAAGRRVVMDGPSLPEFRLWQSHEPGDQAPTPSAAQQKHIATLLRQYESEDTVQQQAEASPSGTGEAWSGEAYERLLPRGVSPDFMRFKKALDRRPQQCVRCGGEPLWPREVPAARRVLKCPQCSSELQFRLQLMSPLLSVLEEAAEWLGYQEAAREAMHEWQWLSVAVFTCGRLCRAAAGLKEDEVVVMNE